MKIYVAGKITGFEDYKSKFQKTVDTLMASGHKVMNPAILPDGFTQNEYLLICFAMIDVCDCVYFLDNWTDSDGAKAEYAYAIGKNKRMMFE